MFLVALLYGNEKLKRKQLTARTSQWIYEQHHIYNIFLHRKLISCLLTSLYVFLVVFANENEQIKAKYPTKTTINATTRALRGMHED